MAALGLAGGSGFEIAVGEDVPLGAPDEAITALGDGDPQLRAVVGPTVGGGDVSGEPRPSAVRSGVADALERRVEPVRGDRGRDLPDVVGGAVIVRRDADLDAVLAAVTRTWTVQAGQVCLTPARLLVDRTVHDEVYTACSPGSPR